jgi:hypothetical protein
LLIAFREPSIPIGESTTQPYTVSMAVLLQNAFAVRVSDAKISEAEFLQRLSLEPFSETGM